MDDNNTNTSAALSMTPPMNDNREVTESNPFYRLETEPRRVNLEDLRTRTTRVANRAPAVGQAIVYDLTGKILAKAQLRNLSRGGVGLEVGAVALLSKTPVNVDFGQANPKMGLVRCQVQWVTRSDDSTNPKKTVGLSFEHLTPKASKILDAYFEDLRTNALDIK